MKLIRIKRRIPNAASVSHLRYYARKGVEEGIESLRDLKNDLIRFRQGRILDTWITQGLFRSPNVRKKEWKRYYVRKRVEESIDNVRNLEMT